MQHAMKREIQTNKEINDCPKIGGVENYKTRNRKHRRIAAKPLMLPTAGRKEKRVEG